MAFSDEIKMRIIRLLGWPANTLAPGSLSYSKIISDRLLVVLPEAEVEAQDLIDRIDSLDAELRTAVSQTGVKRIDDIEFFAATEGGKLQELRRERSRLLLELASLLDIAFGPGLRGRGMGTIRI
jgi:hypothetical protein